MIIEVLITIWDIEPTGSISHGVRELTELRLADIFSPGTILGTKNVSVWRQYICNDPI